MDATRAPCARRSRRSCARRARRRRRRGPARVVTQPVFVDPPYETRVGHAVEGHHDGHDYRTGFVCAIRPRILPPCAPSTPPIGRLRGCSCRVGPPTQTAAGSRWRGPACAAGGAGCEPADADRRSPRAPGGCRRTGSSTKRWRSSTRRSRRSGAVRGAPRPRLRARSAGALRAGARASAQGLEPRVGRARGRRRCSALAISYVFEANTAEAARHYQQLFDDQVAAAALDGAAATANALARLYLETGDLAKAQAWYRTGYDTAKKLTGLPADQVDLWEMRWQHAQSRLAARRRTPRRRARARGGGQGADRQGRRERDPVADLPVSDRLQRVPSRRLRRRRSPSCRKPISAIRSSSRSRRWSSEKRGDAAAAKAFWTKVLAQNGHSLQNALVREQARAAVRCDQRSLIALPRSASACRGRALPASTSTNDEHQPAGDEEEDHRQDRRAARSGERDGQREQQRAEDAGELLEHREEAEELRRLVLRDHGWRRAIGSAPGCRPGPGRRGTPARRSARRSSCRRRAR